MAGSTRNRVGAVDTTLNVLESLRSLNGARVTELADRLDLSKSTVHDHLSTLRDRDYVVKEGDRYDVGIGWLGFGGYARTNLPVYRHAQTAVTDLALETEELALVSIPYRGHSMPVYQARGAKAVTTDSYPGLELPIHCTATGKAMLSRMPAEQVDRILSTVELDRHARNTITDREALLADLETTRERGFSLDDEERIDGMRGIGAAITRGDGGEVLGALALTGPTHRIEGKVFTEELPRLIANMAREVEINIKYEES